MKTKKQNKLMNFLFMAIVIISLTGLVQSATQEELQTEFLGLEQELIDFGYSLNINGVIKNG